MSNDNDAPDNNQPNHAAAVDSIVFGWEHIKVTRLRTFCDEIGIEIRVGATRDELIALLASLGRDPRDAVGPPVQPLSVSSASSTVRYAKLKLQTQHPDEDIDDFIARARRFLLAAKVPEDEWLNQLSTAALPPVNRIINDRFPDPTTSRFEDVCTVLSIRFGIQRFERINRFRRFRLANNETVQDFGEKLRKELLLYLQVSSDEADNNPRFVIPMLLEQLLHVMDAGVSWYVRTEFNKNPNMSWNDILTMAEDQRRSYRFNRGGVMNARDIGGGAANDSGGYPANSNKSTFRQKKKCERHGWGYHATAECRELQSALPAPPTGSGTDLTGASNSSNNAPVPPKPVICFRCGQPGHTANVCRNSENPKPGQH
jgi:hypothetical protein